MKAVFVTAGAVAGALSLSIGALAVAQPPAGAEPTGAQLFQTRCAGCHDPAVDRAPPREDLARRAPGQIIAALTTGTMKPMASGLSQAQVGQIAAFVTGQPQSAANRVEGEQRQPLTGAANPGDLQPADNLCAANGPIKATNRDWNGYGQDLPGRRFQPNTAITAANVDRLKVKWSFAIAGGRYGQPAVIGDHLFVSSYAGHVFSLDADTGCVHWRFKLGAGSRTAPVVGQSGGRWVVYVGDGNRDVYAIDAMTGAQLWKTNVEDHPLSVLTGGPTLYNGVLYVPTSSGEETIASVKDYGCCTFTGSVVAIDAASGKVQWNTPMLPPAQPSRKNSAGTQMFGPAGAAIWSQPSIDPKRGQLYVATGDSYTEVDANRSDSVVALDLKTGAIRWANQVTKDDNFLVGCGKAINCPLGEIGPDHDFGATPILAGLSGGREIVLAGQKSGVVYGMDPNTGKLIWDTKVGAGGALGGVEWGMAYDNRSLYVTISDNIVPRPQAKSGLYALDPATGRIRWSVPAPQVPCSFPSRRCVPAQSAPPSAIPGVVFAGGQDAWLRAYNASTGRTLWMFDAAFTPYDTVNGVKAQPGGSFDGTGPVLANDMLYVISGYVGATGAYGNPVNVLIAFGLKD